jgi:3-hydroxybutyryl-CoA dehydrogenase
VTAVAIIGAGPLGRWLALGAARAGFRVLLEDVMPGNLHHARESIRQELGPQALPAVTFASSIEDAVRDVDLVIDCVPDELESKLEILWLVDRMAPPRTVIATPSTHLSIADLASCTNRPEKCIAIAASPQDLTAGPGVPSDRSLSLGRGAGVPSDRSLSLGWGACPDLLLRAAPATSDETADLVSDFFRQLGFRPMIERSSA